MLALFSSLGLKDCIYSALIIALFSVGVYERAHLINEGKADVERQLAASTAKLTAANNAALAKQAADDAAAITALETSYANALKASDANASALAVRLRNYLAGGGKAAVPGNTAAPGKPDAAPGVSDSVGRALQGVVAAAGHDGDKVAALQAYITAVCHE
jgi:hypothetical protein